MKYSNKNYLQRSDTNNSQVSICVLFIDKYYYTKNSLLPIC